jgi:hypothetical protein
MFYDYKIARHEKFFSAESYTKTSDQFFFLSLFCLQLKSVSNFKNILYFYYHILIIQ